MNDGSRGSRAIRWEAFIEKGPGDQGDWVWAPRADQLYIQGHIPVVAPAFIQRPSGVFVPRSYARQPQPIDLIAVYLTGEEVFGQRLGVELVSEALPRIPRGVVLHECAVLLGLYERIGAVRKEIDLQLIAHWFTEPTRGRLTAEIKAGRVFIAPQAVLLLIKLALLLSPDDGAQGERLALPVALLAIQDGLGTEREAAEEPQAFTGEIQTPLLREVVQSQIVAMRTDEVTTLGRHHLHWKDLSDQFASDPRKVDLESLFAEATGVSLDDFVAVGTTVWAAATQKLAYPLAISQLGLNLDRDRLEAALAVLSIAGGGLRAEVERLDGNFQVQWSFNAIGRYPVVRLDHERLLVLSPRLLLDRIFGWLPLLDLTSGLKAQGRTADASRAKTWFELMCEADALESLRNLMPSGVGTRRFYDEKAIQAAFGTKSRTADAVLEYPEAWVVAEISTRHLTRESVVGGSPEALERDLRLGIDDKVEQIEATIRHLQDDEDRLTGHPAASRRRYLALLVITEGFPVNPMTTIAIESRLRSRGLLTDPRIGPLHILDQEELNLVEAIAERGGPSLLDLLEEHEQGSFRRSAFKDWLLVEKQVEPERPVRIREPYERAWAPVLQAMRRAAGSDEAGDRD